MTDHDVVESCRYGLTCAREEILNCTTVFAGREEVDWTARGFVKTVRQAEGRGTRST